MDAPTRRPRHPPTGPPPRRPLFHTTTTSTSTSTTAPSAPGGARPPPRTTTSKPAHVHIPPDPTTSPSTDLVERDAQGNYKIAGPSAALRVSIEKPIGPEEEEKEQEDAVIAMYARAGAWEQGDVMEEVRAALKSSLQRAVGELEGERWMFEGEGGKGR